MEQAEGMNLSIYECPFPDYSNYQDLIVFELRIPLVIGMLRDMIHLFKVNVLKMNNEGDDTRGNWINYNILSNYSNRAELKVSLRLTLGSTSKSFNQSHYKSQHVRNETESFILPNGYNINLVIILKFCY